MTIGLLLTLTEGLGTKLLKITLYVYYNYVQSRNFTKVFFNSLKIMLLCVCFVVVVHSKDYKLN